MIKTFASTQQAINLLNNGSFEIKGTSLHYWDIEGIGGSSANSYSIVETEGGYPYLQLELSSLTPFRLSQQFGKGVRGTLDFPVPMPSGMRTTIPEGYLVEEAKVLPHGVFYTLAFDIKVVSGSAIIDPIILDLNSEETGETTTLVTYEGLSRLTLSKSNGFKSYSFKFKPARGLYRLGLQITKNSSIEHTQVQITKIGLYAGSYDTTAYTGDPLSRCLPKNSIIMYLGSACPSGFEELGNDDFQPLPSWKIDEPNIEARKGNYPASVSGLSGNTSHTIDNLQIRPGRPDLQEFEGFDSKFVITEAAKTSGSKVDVDLPNPDVDVPDERGTPSHKHVIKSAPLRPVSIPLLFCKRV